MISISVKLPNCTMCGCSIFNDLANSLKPLVLPGEKMNIVVLKEGKEYNQG